jgi:peptidoglycan/LPS O-acetylase OafA/YrhL
MKINYRPEIDGLRAIAVLTVIFYHAEINFFKGGFIGVDIFIVISGYVITKLFFFNNYSLSNFIEKRIRRLFPGLFLMILSTTLFSYFFLLPIHFMNLGQSLIANMFSISNFLFFYQTNYWDSAVLTKPLLHTWSISLEVQFYIFISIIFALFRNYFFKIIFFFFLISIFLILFFNNTVFEINFREFYLNNYFLIFARLWEFLLGSIIAFVLNIKRLDNYFKKLNFFHNFGLLVILISLFIVQAPINYPNLSTFIPVLGSAIIILSSNNQNSHFLLNNSFLIHIGKISYSLYLWHFPILIFFFYSFDFNLSFLNKIYALLITYFISLISYKFIELPFYKKKFLQKKSFFLLIALGFVFILILGVLISSQILKSKLHLNYLKIKNDFPNYNFFQIPKRVVLDNQFTNSGKIKILVCGDSHGFNLVYALQSNSEIKKKYEIELSSFGSCLNDTSLKIKKSDYVLSSIQIEGSRYNKFEDIEKLYKIVKTKYNKKFIIVSATPEFQTDTDLLLNYLVQNNISKDDLISNIPSINRYFYNNLKFNITNINKKLFIISKNLNVIFLNKFDYICNEEVKFCYGIDQEGKKLFFDYSHYTNDGAIFFGKKIYETDWLKLN